MITRRKFLLTGLIAAPAIVCSSHIMPVKLLKLEPAIKIPEFVSERAVILFTNAAKYGVPMTVQQANALAGRHLEQLAA